MCLKTLITGIRNLENDSRKDASERMCDKRKMKMVKVMGNLVLLILSKSYAW